MIKGMKISVIIPVLNEEKSIGGALSSLPSFVDEVIVVDNGCTDKTSAIAKNYGALLVYEPRRGYGSACLAGIKALGNPDVVVFMDGDASDCPEEMEKLLEPILNGNADMVIGSRVLGQRDPGALTPQSRFGNLLACKLIRLFWGAVFTDLGPFRAIRFSTFKRLNMQDKDFGWTVEMQIKAAILKIRCTEVPVRYRKRIGKSKISGTVQGVLRAGIKILWTIFYMAVFAKRNFPTEPAKNRLLVFTRYPEPGKAKTRLIPALGMEGAAKLSKQLTEHTLMWVMELTETMNGVSVEICFEGGTQEAMREWLGESFCYVPQGEGDLGKRLQCAVQRAFNDGVEKVVVVGTDCPLLALPHVQSSFEALEENEVVLGPAKDGGYYLLGLRENAPSLFKDIPWGTGDVFEKTFYAAKKSGLSVFLLEKLQDVDVKEDLVVWEKAQKSMQNISLKPALSVIIPALNEAENIEARLSFLKKVGGVEILVVDGGSQDKTVEKAEASKVKVIHSLPGRARQMNAGAREAKGDILLFLHADTQLPIHFDVFVREAMSHLDVVAGAFEFTMDATGLGFRLFERIANRRARKSHKIFGDQAIFVRRRIFFMLGGFSEIPILEDYEFVRRMKKYGRVDVVPAAVVTSSRRFIINGILKTFLLNRFALLSFHLGISPERIALLYHHFLKSSGEKIANENQVILSEDCCEYVNLMKEKTHISYARLLLKGYRLKPVMGDAYQLGADFVVDKEGVVRLAYYSKNPADRPSVETLLSVVRETQNMGKKL